MASNKDILDAQKFNRTRLVTAFMSGTPGGRELEPRSFSGPLIVGLLISGLIVAGSMLAARWLPKLSDGWQHDSLIIASESGARFLSRNGVLRPVSNVTSARLLAEGNALKVVTISESELKGIPRGSAVGVPQFPDNLPAAKGLTSDVTACSSDGNIHTWVGIQPGEFTPFDKGSAVLVRGPAMVRQSDKPGGAAVAEPTIYLLQGSTKYRVSLGTRSFGHLATQLGTSSTMEKLPLVSGQFLSLFRSSINLGNDALAMPADKPAPSAGITDGPLKNTRIGDVLQIDVGGVPKWRLLVGKKETVNLTPFAKAIYTFASGREPLVTTMGEIDGLKLIDVDTYTASWPKELPKIQELATPCLRTAPSLPEPVLGSTKETIRKGSTTAGAAPEAVSPAQITVGGGAGMLVTSGVKEAPSPLLVVNDFGIAYAITFRSEGAGAPPVNPALDPVAGELPLTDVLARLQYKPENIAVLPAAWLALFPSGPEPISRVAAYKTMGEQ